MAKKNPILQTNACEWKTSRLLVLLMGKLRLQSSSWYWYVSARRCCFLGWDKQDCPPPVPLPLISTLKILWPRCLNAAQGHPLPLLSCYPPCPGLWKLVVAPSSHWDTPVSQQFVFLGVAASLKILPVNNNPSGCCWLHFVSGLYAWRMSKSSVWMNVWYISEWQHAAETEVCECLSFKKKPTNYLWTPRFSFFIAVWAWLLWWTSLTFCPSWCSS